MTPSPSMLRVATAGSVDDGKSTLIGRLLYESEAIADDQLAALAEASEHRSEELNLALIMDGLRAEREQNITIDVAYRPMNLGSRRLLLADSPGHAQYTRNMVTAASTAHVAMILVDAAKGASEQTNRHFSIAAMLRVPVILVVVNKIDLVDFSQFRFEEIAEHFRAMASKLGAARLHVMPVCALAGDNVTSSSPRTPWYEGPNVRRFLEEIEITPAEGEGFRMHVQCVLLRGTQYRGLAGTPASGRLRVNDEVQVVTSGRSSRVRALLGPTGEIDEVHAGVPVSMELEDDLDASRGDLVCGTSDTPVATCAFEARVCWLSSEPLRVGMSYRLMQGSRITPVRVEKVLGRSNMQTLQQEDAQLLAMNDLGALRITSGSPVFLDEYKNNPGFGHFILIDPSNQTAAAGVVEQVQAAEPGKAQSKAAPVVWLTGLSGAGKSTIAEALEEELLRRHVNATHLDGDALRTGLCSNLGFAPEDRLENVRRVAEVAKLFSVRGITTICSLISPLKEYRELARSIIGDAFVETYVQCDISVCQERDPKGLYKLAASGAIKQFTGVSAPYEAPEDAEVVVRTDQLTVAECVSLIVEFLRENKEA